MTGKNFIDIHIMGGLGNQLYQYAAARYVQKYYGFEKLKIDTSGYKNYTIRNFELGKFVLNDNVEIVEKNDVKTTSLIHIFHVYQKIYSMLYKQHMPMYDFHIGEDAYICSSVEMREPTIKKYGRMHMYGYFVSADIMLAMRKELSDELRLKDERSPLFETYKELLKHGNNVAISIRCANDYVDNGWPICSKEYYMSGIEKIKKLVSHINILVFADDLEIIKRERWFEGYDITYVEGLSVCESFELLRCCEYYVCSNSSFSWWGSVMTYCSNPYIIHPNAVFPRLYEKDDQKTFLEGIHYLDYSDGSFLNN